MAQTIPSSKLKTREGRLKRSPKRNDPSIEIGKRYWCGIENGLALGYRRGTQGSGTWQARLRLSNGRYVLRPLGTADDYTDANGSDVLTFAQAQRRAQALHDAAKRDEGVITRPVTVGDAAAHYLEWFAAERKSLRETKHTIDAHILPTFERHLIAALKSTDIKKWHQGLATQPARIRTSRIGKQKQQFKAKPKTDDQKRARHSTANRVLTVLKAILNKAFTDKLVSDDSEWRRVKPFKKVDAPRVRFLTTAEAIRLVNACPADLRKLVRGALLTGARYSELAGMQVSAVDLKNAHVYIAPSKSGLERHVPLNAEGLALFRALVTGKTGDSLVFAKADGSAWGRNHYVRPLKEACKVGKIRPAATFHVLRHTYASHLAQAGEAILNISKLLGHADTRVTARHYAHLADKTLADAVAKLPSFGDSPESNVAAIR